MSEDRLVTVVCPGCKAEKQLPDTVNRKVAYRYNVCKRRLTSISNTDFGRLSAFALMAWGTAAALVWVSVYLAPNTGPSSNELVVARMGFQLSFAIAVTTIAVTVYFLQKGLGHRKFVGVAPEGFRRFVLVSVLSACTCFAASGLAFAWWDWRA